MIRSSTQGTYTPKPISQTCLVYPKKEQMIEPPETSIKINMMSLEVVSEEQSKEEEETIETLSSFIPLSTTPAVGMISEDNFDVRDRIRSDEEVHDAHALANRKIQTQSRWKTWVSFVLILLIIWAAFVSVNKSFNEFLADPIEATAAIFRGDLRQPKAENKPKRLKAEVYTHSQGALEAGYFAQGTVELPNVASLPEQIKAVILCEGESKKNEYLSRFIYHDDLNDENAFLFYKEDLSAQNTTDMKYFKPAQVEGQELNFSYIYYTNEGCTPTKITFKLF